MNELSFRIMGLYKRIEKNNNLSNKLKMLAGASLFFTFCYCMGTKSIGNIDKSQALVTNLVWIISIIVLIGLFIKDSNCVKNNKVTEFEIYRLEVEDLNNKKDVARITGKQLPDYVLNKQIAIPYEEVSLPIIYYGILLGLDIMIRFYLFVNNVL